MVVEWSGSSTASGNHEQQQQLPHPRYLSASLCCIWEQPAVQAPPPPPPPRTTTVAVLRPPEARRPRCLADRASWAGFSSSVLARGRSNVLMGTQVLQQQQPGPTPLYGPRELPPAASTPLRPHSDVEETRLDPPVGHAQHPVSAFAMDARKQQQQQQGRRRSREVGAGRQLRSPAVQRPPTARVTLQGWLHKQGSEGLMLWKRRWFVLSEYCLFYYKGPEEEKLLGSILLPSYKVSPCAPDDRVFRKFCFKAEHQNMRTYFFAADSRELMVRWMNALSLASILQTDTLSSTAWTGVSPGRPSVSSISQSADDSDSGFHGFRTPRGAAPNNSATTPRQVGDGSAQPPPSSAVPAVGDTAPAEVNGWPPRFQPLYANAPPKPRRLTSQGDSPDPSPDRAGSRQTPPPPTASQQPNKEQPAAEYARQRGYGMTPTSRNPYHFHPQVNGPTERRTPDTYGRSNNVSRADYEDVYAERYGAGWFPPPPQAYLTDGFGKPSHPAQQVVDQAAYPKNLPPQKIHVYQVEPNYGNKPQHGYLPDGTYAKGVYVKPTGPPKLEYNPITPPATLVKQPLPYPTFRMSSPAPPAAPITVQTRPKSSSAHPPRPHSADFLEKDTRHIPESAVVMRRERPGHGERPKSSVDMYHDYWSEESYAQKMRQSLYMHAQTGRANTPLQRPQDSRLRPPSLERGRTPQPQSPASTLGVRRHEEQTPPQQQQQNTRRYSEQAERLTGNNQFMRSASARLPRQRAAREEAEQQEPGPGSERKIQQREESMQRLLEWKQRMLQSPLTRKSSPRPHDPANNAAPSPLSHLQLLRSSVDGPTGTVSEAGSSSRPRRQPSRGSASSSGAARSRSQDPGRRSAPPAHRRNSYSSDDEEVHRESSRGSRRNRRPSSHHQQAGRTPPSGRQSATGEPPVPGPQRRAQTALAAETLPSPSPDYVNVNALNERRERGPERADNLSNELRQLGIPPDVSYADAFKKQKQPSPSSKEQTLLPGSKYGGDALNLGVGHFYPALGSKTAATHKLPPTEDRGSNGKHSDSGYDTLRAQEAAEAKRSALRSPIIHALLSEPPDESRLIKEFSYEYIRGTTPDLKSTGRRQKQSPQNKSNPASPEKDRITPTIPTVDAIAKKQDGLKMQDPLQPSQPIYHSNEAHVSSLKSPDRDGEGEATQEIASLRKAKQNSLRTFAFGESSPEDQVSNNKEVPSTNPRSVRELLADFERKSAALAKEQLQAEQERNTGLDSGGRRCVFSDTETLLYDTSSDAELPANEDEPTLPRLQHPPRRCVSRAGDRSEDEDDDAEVAAALGRRDKFFSACRDLSRRKEAAAGLANKENNVRRRKVPRGKPQADVVDEVIVTPGYLRLSLAESMVAHEDSASSRSSPSPNPPVNETHSRIKTPETVVSEEHYMPMTPSRRPVLAPPPASCMILEESSYVEMAEDGGMRNLPSVFQRDELRRLNSGGSSGTYATPESPPYCEINEKQEKADEESSHYEFLYLAKTKYEPVYMEVKQLDALKPLNLSSKLTKDGAESKEEEAATSADKISALPDILNSTSASQQRKPEDSDDADDEASKDLDSLDTPRHPRFSLSDTFRPASYYLGASECAPEQHDSSDSDLVSPPPIPTSPPPLDDELDEEFPLDLRKNSHSTPAESRKFPERSSSQAERKSLQGSLDGSTISDTLTDSSRLKRRPVSEEMLDSLEETSFLMNSLSESSVATTCKDMPTTTSRFSLQDELRARDALLGYPKDLTYGFCEAAYHKESFQQRENMYATNKPTQKDNKSEMLLLSNRVRFTSEEILPPPPPPPTAMSPDSILMRSRHIRSPSLEEALNSNLDISQLPPPEEAPKPIPPAQAQHFDMVEGAGAPYYYSDLLRADEDGFASSTSELSVTRLPPPPMQPPHFVPPSVRARPPMLNQLNNQRDMLDLSKRNDIGRKVNPIISAPLSPTSRADVEEVDVTRIAAEIRTTTAGLAAKTVQPVDSRNIYEADTLRKMARRRQQQQQQYVQSRRSQTPDPDLETRNLYPQGLRDKSEIPLESRRRSRSLEGLLDDDDTFLDAPRLPPTAGPQERRRRSSGAPRPSSSRSTNPSEGSDPWEEDVLWRESLRRVSLRHTRSLDDLDDDDTSPARAPGPSRAPPSGRRSVDVLSSRERVAPRVSREVTYVNDSAARNRMLRTKRELYENDYREGRRHDSTSVPPLPPVAPEEEDSGVYERLARTSESLERSRRGQTYVEGYEWDVDRETFRQGETRRVPQQQTQQPPLPVPPTQQQQHFLEESLPPSFEIDREKLRQWDLLSSAPLEGGTSSTVGTASTVSTRPVGSEGMREGSVVATSISPSVLPPPPQGEAVGGGRHLDLATQQPVPPPPPPPPPQPQLGRGRGEPPPPPPSSEGSGSGSMRDTLPAPRGSGGRHHPQQQQRASPMSSQQQQPLLQAGVNGHPGSMAGGGGGTGAGPSSRGASPQRLLNGGHPGHSSDMPDESSNTSDSELMRKPPPAGSSNGNPMTPGWPPSTGVSAGELLGRTHEELVLLLIQLRRQSAALRHAAELCRADVIGQARLAELDAARRAEHLRRLEELKRHLQEIEKQYEKGKPLVHLVDNMVKLGSLYRGPPNTVTAAHSLPRATCTPPPLQRLEFNLQVQEQRLLAEERREWNRLSPPDHTELQAKVQQLYRLDRLLQEESVTIQSLQQDKALLERALGGLRHKLAGSAGPEAERYRRQQRLLERELSRVRHLLAANSKKLEETVAENARLEHELVLLRQKLQATRSTSPSAASPLHTGGGSTVALELELRRVQNLVGDLQRQRHDLSAQVRQLTEKSQTLAQQIRPQQEQHHASKQRAGRPTASWLETDLDSLHTQDVGDSPQRHHQQQQQQPDPRTPLYVNTEALEGSGYGIASRSEDTGTSEELSPPPPPAPESAVNHAGLNGGGLEAYEPQDISEADERTKRFYGIIPRAEKAEIKTVRIVKRESERRSRVKRPTTLEGDLGRVLEEDTPPPPPPPPSELELSLLLELQREHEQQAAAAAAVFQRSLSLPRGFGKQPPPPPPMRAPSPRSEAGTMRTYTARYRPPSPEERPMSAHAQLFGEHVMEEETQAEGSSSSGPVSPVYQSEAARAIVQEMTRRRAVPKTKRRHHTVAGRLQQALLPSGSTGARARDDLDMERALRRRVAGAPDVVRSTLSHRELKYNEGTIDSILGTPNKILIPERYVPEQEPELTAEEQLQRLKKAESIRKMLSETTPISAPEAPPAPRNGETNEDDGSSTMKLKLAAEKRQREHLLQLNQLLAQQVMEKSKIVAVRALATTPRREASTTDDDDLSPVTPLPLVQQRDNFYS